MEFFDTHAHLDDEQLIDDLNNIYESMKNNKVKYVTIPSSNIESAKNCIKIAEKYENTFVLIGIHPESADSFRDEDILKLEELAKHEKVVGIGEVGLDYYWRQDNFEKQKEILKKQIELANKLKLPVALHIRDANTEMIDFLKENPVEKKGIFHCVPLDEKLIKEGVELGYYISFSGVITFKNVKNVDECIKLVPKDKILIETDSPYLTPDPYRGRRNDPSKVIFTAKKIANVLNITEKEIAKITTENAKRVYSIE